MRLFVVLVTLGTALAAFGAIACGPGNDKPPLQPDPTSSGGPAVSDEAGAPAPPAK